nr:dephospho-CoA kinase [Chromobacterium phragmitis]
MDEIVQAFGAGAAAADGSLDRAAMRARVFAAPEERKRLEAILHPAIYQESARQLALADGDYALLVVPLLFESGRYLPLLARTLAVDCGEDAQIERVMRRSGLSADAVRAIMAAQVSREERRRRADDVIDNSGGMAELRLQVDAKHSYYLANLVKALL